MSNNQILYVIQIVQELAEILVFLGAGAASFFVLRQEKVKTWLLDSGRLVQIVVFLILTGALASIGFRVVDALFGIFMAIVVSDQFMFYLVQCLGGLLVLAGLIAGSIMLVRKPVKKNEESL
jgi:hypothetical protein